MLCTTCGVLIVESVLGIEVDRQLHRYINHGTVEERIIRWIGSVAAGVFISWAVPKALKEIRSA